MMQPDLSFIIPVRNDAVRLKRCLASITSAAASTSARVELIVADNGSTDDTPAAARVQGASVVSVPGRVVAAVRNKGAAESRGHLLAFVDADHELHGGWVEAALTIMQDSHVAAAGSDYHPPLESTWVQRMYDRLRRHPGGPETVEWLPSGNLVGVSTNRSKAARTWT
jgi:glycosyltransferase involved in cell wall biosynthesis